MAEKEEEEFMPDYIPENDAVELMATIQGFCNESTLRRTEIIGALEAVKFALLCAWTKEVDE